MGDSGETGEVALKEKVVSIALKNCAGCEPEKMCLAHRDLLEDFENEIDDAIRERLDTPEMLDFLRAVKVEAQHQRDRWKKTDPMKSDADWYWLIGYLGGKALMDPHEPEDERTSLDRRLHRIITVAAAAYNWHEAAKGGKNP